MHWKIDLAKLHILNSLPCTSLELVKPGTNISAARRSASSSTNLASKYSIVQACSFFLIFIFSAFRSTLYFLMRFRNRSACLTLIALLFALLPGPAASQETSWKRDPAARWIPAGPPRCGCSCEGAAPSRRSQQRQGFASRDDRHTEHVRDPPRSALRSADQGFPLAF